MKCHRTQADDNMVREMLGLGLCVGTQTIYWSLIYSNQQLVAVKVMQWKELSLPCRYLGQGTQVVGNCTVRNRIKPAHRTRIRS